MVAFSLDPGSFLLGFPRVFRFGVGQTDPALAGYMARLLHILMSLFYPDASLL